METKVKRKLEEVRPLLTSAILLVVISTMVGCHFGFYYSSNDDIMLHNLMSGDYTGAPIGHLVYIMYAFGIIVKYLYQIFQQVDWYGCFAVVGHIGCVGLICYRLSFLKSEMHEKICVVVISWIVLIAIDLKYMVAYQYTVAAGVFATTALIGIITFKCEKRWKDIIWIAIMLTFSCLLRKQIFLMALPLLLCSVCIKLLAENSLKNKEKVAFIGKASFLFAVLITVMVGVEKYAYSTDEWEEYLAFNEVRTSVYDYALLPEYAGNETFYDSVGISEPEYTALKQMDIEFVKDANTELLEAVSSKQKSILKDWKQYYNVPLHFLKVGLSGFLSVSKTPAGIVLSLLTILGLIYSLQERKIVLAIFSLLPFVFDMAVSAYFVNLNRFPERVYFPLLLMSIVPLAYIVIKLSRGSKVATICMCIILIPLVAWQIRNTVEEKHSLEAKAEYWEDLNKYFSDHSDSLWILDPQVYASTAERIFSDTHESNNTLKLSTWLINSPNQKEREIYVGKKEKTYLVVPRYYSIQWINDVLGEIDESKIKYRNELMFIEVKYPFFE